MFELIGGLIYLIFIGVAWCVKMLFKSLIYTWPLLLCFFAFFGGGSLADGIFGDKYSEQTLADEYIITVHVHWENGEQDSYLTVRRDLEWSLADGCKWASPHATNGAYDRDIPAPEIPTKAGYRFLGLYTSPSGGSMVVSPGGYSVLTLSGDIELYAVWEPVGASVGESDAWAYDLARKCA